MPSATRLPQALAVARGADRRIHLQARAEAGIVGRVEGEMLRRQLDRDVVLVVADEVDLLGGRDVEEMDARAGLVGDARQPLGRAERRDLVAPDRMRRRIAFDAQAHALA